MRALIQRCSRSSVRVDGQAIGEIGQGLCVFLGATHADTEATADQLARKVATLRIFEDADGKMNNSLLDVGGAALVVSQFTLYADTKKGRRPAFVDAARPDHAEPLYERFCARLVREGVEVATGRFQARMEVSIVNDGPVTIMLEA